MRGDRPRERQPREMGAGMVGCSRLWQSRGGIGLSLGLRVGKEGFLEAVTDKLGFD